MHQQWQYPEHAEPVFVPAAAAPTPTGWRPMMDEPVIRRVLSAALLVTALGAFVAPVPVAAAPVTVASWYQPLSEPASRTRRVVDPQTGAERPVFFAVRNIDWYPQLEQPTARARRLPDYNTGAERPVYFAVRNIDWYPQLEQPTARARRLPDYSTGADYSSFFSVRNMDWYRPLDEPTPIRRLREYKTGAEAPERSLARVETVRLEWYQPLSTPILVRRLLTPLTGAESPLSFTAAPPPLVTLSWLSPLDVPLQRAAHRQDFRTGGEQPVLAALRRFDWYQPLAEPVRRTRQVIDPTTGAEIPLYTPSRLIDWYQPLSLPTRRVLSPLPGTGAEWPIVVRRVTFDWMPELSQPVRRRPSLASTWFTNNEPLLLLAAPFNPNIIRVIERAIAASGLNSQAVVFAELTDEGIVLSYLDDGEIIP